MRHQIGGKENEGNTTNRSARNKTKREQSQSINPSDEFLLPFAKGANGNVSLMQKTPGYVRKIVVQKNIFRRMISYARLVLIFNLMKQNKIDSKHLISIRRLEVIDKVNWHYEIEMEEGNITLQDFINSNQFKPQASGLFINIFVQLIEALNNLHKHGLSYNDLKPENIVLKRKTVKFIDLQSISSIEDVFCSQIGNTVYSHSCKLESLAIYAETVQKFEMHSLSLILFQLFEKEIKIRGYKKKSIISVGVHRQRQNNTRQAYKIPQRLSKDMDGKFDQSKSELVFQKLRDQPVIRQIINNMYHMNYESLGELIKSDKFRELKQKVSDANQGQEEEEPFCTVQILQMVNKFIIKDVEKRSSSNLPQISRKQSAKESKQKNLIAESIINNEDITMRKLKEIANLYIQADVNLDGKVSYKEFELFFKGIIAKEKGRTESMKSIFNKIDEDKNGSISIQEYSQLFEGIISKQNKTKLYDLLRAHYHK